MNKSIRNSALLLFMVTLSTCVRADNTDSKSDSQHSQTKGSSATSSTSTFSSSSFSSSSSSSSASLSTLPPTTELPSDYPPMLRVGKDGSALYYVNLTLGVPQQQQSLRLDVAQPYLWVSNGEDPQNDSLCTTSNTGCSSALNVYYPNDSTTNQYWDPDYHPLYNMSFIDGLFFNGTAYNDELSFGSNVYYENMDTASSLNLNNISFFVSDYSENMIGALGLGGKINDTDLGNYISQYYFDESFYFLDQMVAAGLLNTSSYSIWLGGDHLSYQNSSEDGTFQTSGNVGRVILGAVDKSLYSGDLVQFNNIPYYNVSSQTYSYGYPIIPLTRVNVISNTSEYRNLTDNSFIEPVLIDSRYTFSYLPLVIMTELAIQTNAFYVRELGSWYVNCELAEIGAFFELQFGNLNIKLPLEDIMGKTYDSVTKKSIYFNSGAEACVLKVRPSYRVGFSILGAPFLKNVYFAADLDNFSVAIAQAKRLNTSLEPDTYLSKRLVPQDSPQEKVVYSQQNGEQSVAAKTTSTKHSSVSSAATTTASSSSSLSSSSSSSSSTTSTSTYFSGNMSIGTITSGYIPFAKTNNITTQLYLTPFSATSFTTLYGSNILEIFGYNITVAPLFSNGIIVTATRSFYETTLAAVAASTAGSTTRSLKNSNSNQSLFANPTQTQYEVWTSTIQETIITTQNGTIYQTTQNTVSYSSSVLNAGDSSSTQSMSAHAQKGKEIHKTVYLGLQLVFTVFLGAIFL